MFSSISLIFVFVIASLAVIAYFTSSKTASIALSGALFFTVVAPPIGALTFFVGYVFSTGDNFGIVHVILMFIPMVVVSYQIGVLPAILVGALMGIFSTRLRVFRCVLLAGILGIGASIVLNGKWGHGLHGAFEMLRLIDLLPSTVAAMLSTVGFYVLNVRHTNIGYFRGAQH
jgi:high-affinity K+ transport system ATPase subunit B